MSESPGRQDQEIGEASPSEVRRAPGANEALAPTSRSSRERTRDQLVPRSGVARGVEEVLRFLRKGFARFAELSPTQLNLSWVTDDLAVGGAVHTRHIPRLKAMGIEAVVDCREEATDDEVALARNGIDFLRLPTPDAHTLAQGDLDRGVSWVKERLARGEKVYVHCSHGVGRGPLLAACFLVSEGYSPVNALQIVRTRRWQASPNEEQVDGLVTYAERRKATAEP